MAYSELIKNFNRIRAYLREFYVFGFRHRNEYAKKSSRSYDNERRRVESWLGDYMSFGQDADGKRVFLSVDSRSIYENPLFRAFRTKSFTDTDIMLHFYIIDILSVTGQMTISAFMEELVNRLCAFGSNRLPDESTVRKKLKEYAALEIINIEKRGRETVYSINKQEINLPRWKDAVAFFSESAPLGVIGSYIQDRLPERFKWFRFKHHYILDVLDSEIVFHLLQAMNDKYLTEISVLGKQLTVLPLKIYVGTQSGRQYVLAWKKENDTFSFHRLDLIDKVKVLNTREITGVPINRVEDFQSHIWGVNGSNSGTTSHIEMTVLVEPGEDYIVQRLMREKRCGTVERIDDTHWKFSADVYGVSEMLPWLRTFTGRITDLVCTDEKVTERLWRDFDDLSEMYGGKGDAIS